MVTRCVRNDAVVGVVAVGGTVEWRCHTLSARRLEQRHLAKSTSELLWQRRTGETTDHYDATSC